MIRTGSYYAYNADDGSFLACGSSNKETSGMTVLITKQIELSLQQEHEIIEI